MRIHANLANAYSRYTASNDSSPGRVDEKEAREMIKITRSINNESSASSCGGSSYKGDQSLRQLLNNHPDKFDADAKELINGWLRNHRMPAASTEPSRPVDGPDSPSSATGPGKTILNWQASKKTWHCHWFPYKADTAGGDVINNLWANGGALAKYDAAFGGKSQSYEKANFSTGDSWFGHCNFASQVAALLKEPIRDVTMNGVTFTAHDISGLLVKVVQSLAVGEDFVGNRYNGPSDDPNDPNPVVFLEDVLKAWCKPGQPPIILDIDKTSQVWNYPYDQVKVTESTTPPQGFNADSLPRGGKTKYYKAEMKGTGFPEQERNYQFWIQYDSSGKPTERGYIHGEDPKVNPDFAWRSMPVGDLDKASSWVTRPGQNNPYVLAENVYKLYKASIA